jgi:hypothetical protein
MVTLSLAIACGGTAGEEELEAPGQRELQAAALMSPVDLAPAPAESNTQTDRVNGCQYTLAVVTHFPPALRSLLLTREPSPNCEAGTVTLVDQAPPFLHPTRLLLAEKRNELVASWMQLAHPLYGINTLHLSHISPETLETVRRTAIAPYYKSGSILEASLEFQGHRLIIHGTKTGVFSPTEPWGVYPHFTATYPHFFTSTEAPEIALHE